MIGITHLFSSLCIFSLLPRRHRLKKSPPRLVKLRHIFAFVARICFLGKRYLLLDFIIDVFEFLHLVSESHNLPLRRQEIRLRIHAIRHERLLIGAHHLLLHLAVRRLEELHDLLWAAVGACLRVLHLIVIRRFRAADLFYLRGTELCCKKFLEALHWVLLWDLQHSFAQLLPK